jgi:putative heme-binding domain-containing protein
MKNLCLVSLVLGGCLIYSACQSPRPTDAASTGTAPPTVASASPRFELRDGDRVVFLGDTLMEREQYYGWIELALTTHFPERHITFRNLGWSADTPEGLSRSGLSLLQAGLEPADEGWKQLQEQIKQTQPTVVFLGYGMASSFAGEAGLSKFKTDMNRLMDTLAQISPGVRFVLLSPIRHEKVLGPARPISAPTRLAEIDRHNAQLKFYTEAIAEIARARSAPFVSLFDAHPDSSLPSRNSAVLTDDGIHLDDRGYRKMAAVIESQLFSASKPGAWTANPKAEALRQVILRKNKLFFDRSRPQNMAYIFGFRKREQGKNSVEIPQFDPLIAVEEKTIAQLRDLKSAALATPAPAGAPIRQLTPQPHPTFQVADGFEITLWAENPQLDKPIQMNFDPQGRLWVVSSEVYPQIEPGQVANDKVLILEDTNGSGRANKSTVFVDGLMVPTGIAPGDGGVYVANSTELLHFKDSKGTGKADTRRVVLSGFGTEDTHHILHTLQWGVDGQLYFDQSIYIRTHTETPHGVKRLYSGGVWNFRPATLELDIFLRGFCNPWGHAFDEYGQSFVTDGAGFQGVSWGVPGAMYFTYAKGRRLLESISPGNYPKFASLEIIQSRHFPDDWQGDMITCDFRAHRIVRFKASEQGAGYVTKAMPDLVRTSEATFRPIDVKLGPDGALYVADWSNPIIQHGEVDFRDPRRDHSHGRIWRVTAKNRPLNRPPDLSKAGNVALLGELLSPNSYERFQASRTLTERGPAIVKDLDAWTKKQSDEKSRLRALWMYQALDQTEPRLLEGLLNARDGHIRAAAVRVLSYWLNRLPNGGDLLARRIADEDPRVRVEAARGLAKIPTARSAELVLSALDRPMDPFLDYALWLSINDLAEPWITALKSGEWKTEGREKQLEFGLKAIEPSRAASVLAQLLQTRPLDRSGRGSWIELLGTSGGPEELKKLFEPALAGGFDDAATARALAALNQAARLRNARPASPLENIAQLFGHANEKVRVEALRLAGAWKDLKQNFPQLTALAGASASSPDVRQAAIDALREIGGRNAIEALTPLAAKDQPLEIRRAAVIALAALNLNRSVPEIVDVLISTTAEAEALSLWRSLLNVRGAGLVIARGLPKTGLPNVTARTGLRVAQEGGRRETELVGALSVSAAPDLSASDITPELLKQLAARALQDGDPARGELVYRRAQLACVACHSIGGSGGKVGPDLTSLGASAPADYLVEALLLPNAKIKEGYHSILLETSDGQEFSGILVRETEQELIVRNAANVEVSVAKNKIQKRSTGLSLMPSGLVEALPLNERLDLIRFLSELGKPGPYDAAQGGVARAWKLLSGTHTLEQFGPGRIVKGEVAEAQWRPVLSLVDGRLLRQEIQAATAVFGNPSLVSIFASAQFQTQRNGPVKLQLEGATEVWIDGQPAASAAGLVTANLPAGSHTIIVRMDARDLPEQLRLKSADATFGLN